MDNMEVTDVQIAVQLQDSDRLTKLENNLISLQEDFELIKKENSQLNKFNLNLENQLQQFNQYNRRENIEIANIPETVRHHQLEEYCIYLLNSINPLNIQSYDIVALHRLGNKPFDGRPRNVIIRFMNRKIAYDSLDNGYRLTQISMAKGNKKGRNCLRMGHRQVITDLKKKGQ